MRSLPSISRKLTDVLGPGCADSYKKRDRYAKWVEHHLDKYLKAASPANTSSNSNDMHYAMKSFYRANSTPFLRERILKCCFGSIPDEIQVALGNESWEPDFLDAIPPTF